jgi:hypothetical protein
MVLTTSVDTICWPIYQTDIGNASFFFVTLTFKIDLINFLVGYHQKLEKAVESKTSRI